jgi:Trk K+ transport system NAD-binding subunit
MRISSPSEEPHHRPIKEGHLVIIGFGDVGRRIVKVLCKSDVHPVVVDRRDLREHRFRHAVGDGTSEDVLVEAGIKDAIGILVMLNSDADVIYATLMSRNLNPEAFIIARANHVRSAEKIYRAGADYVASVPIIASHMLARIIKSEEEDLALLYEDVDLIKFTVTEKSILAGKSLDKINLPARFGCTVVAVDRDGKAIAGPGPELVLEEGDVLAIIGESEEIDSFIQAQRRRLAPRITNNR